MLKELPLGTSIFETLRATDELYVDKTDLIYQLARRRSKCFLARPRRFGKSLLISTFESLFQYGLRDFQGLAIEPLWKDKPYPVARLDFSRLTTFRSYEEFKERFQSFLQSAFIPLGFVYRRELDSLQFLEQLGLWIASLPPNSLVVLIDEYDAPLTAHLEDREKFEAVRDCLQPFYALLKEYEGRLRFFFMTGITKFSNTSVFSAFNNLRDISLDPEYGTLLGYTEEEMRAVFLPYVDNAADVLGMTREEVLSRLKEQYDGFSFDREASHRVYCPWSVLNFLSTPKNGFLNYWYVSGGRPTVLTKYLVNHALAEPISYSEERKVTLFDLTLSQQYDYMSIENLLMQAGYYTIRSVLQDETVVLGYPNREVAISMAQLYAEELLQGKNLRNVCPTPALSVLSSGAAEEVVSYFTEVLRAIDYQRYPVKDEATCRGYLQVLLIGAAMLPSVEVHNAFGRSDLEVEAGDRLWVFEIKCARESKEVDSLLREAVEQMGSRHYGSKRSGKKVIRMALVFDVSERGFSAWKCQ